MGEQKAIWADRTKFKDARAIIEKGGIHVFRRDTYEQVDISRVDSARTIYTRRLQKVEYLLKMGDEDIPIVGECAAKLIHTAIHSILSKDDYTVPRVKNTTQSSKVPSEVPSRVSEEPLMRVETVN